jgi:hypothetical protein
MTKYQHGKIYKIDNDVDNLIYVGSTIQPLNIRFSDHKCASKLHPERKIYKHFMKLGIDHFEIKLIKNYPCNNKLELEIEEERYKIMLNAQLNTIRAHQTAKQRKEQLKANGNIYYQKNCAKIKETTKLYYKNNRAKINETTKIYREKNRAKILLKKNERILCKICGKTYTRTNKAQHNRSKHHKKCVKFNQSKNETNRKYEKCVQFNNSI